MYRMLTSATTRKVKGTTIAVALATLLIWGLETFVLHERLPSGIPTEIQGVILTVVLFVTGYSISPGAQDQIVAVTAPEGEILS
ncbi:hypothetical protein [Yoonia sp. SDW83-1]|uniref:hypothetical protein n=1 Tax=Yoonia sp. SDW83-1 TaxID=3366945 RepID=UPI00398C6AFB